jgi:anti-sigma factor RsiW
MTIVPCSSCGEPVDTSANRCPHCGVSRGATVTAGIGAATWTGYAPTIIIFGSDAATGDVMHTVQAPDARSQARRSSAWTVSVVVEGPPGVGTSGEHRVAKVLRARLQTDGVPSALRSGADARGEDRLIDTPHASYVLQVVTVPHDSTLWREASAGSGTTSVTTPAAAGWIEDAIGHKVASSTTADRRRTILALDAMHAGVLTEDAVVQSYLEQYGNPAARFEYAGVWLVGPIAARCLRLGTGVL